MKKKQPLLILGANSKVGKEIAIEFSKNSHDIILCLRTPERLDNFSKELEINYKNKVILKEFDILNKNLFKKFLNDLPLNPSIVVSTIGIMDQEENKKKYSIEQIINTNYLNQIIFFELLSEYLILRNSSSTIISFGSVAGIRGRKKNYIYGSSKAGLHCYLSGLRQKYNKKNLNIITLIPGYINTDLLDTDLKKRSKSFLISSPNKVARIVYSAYKSKKSIIYTPYWRLIMGVINIIPEYLFKKLSF